MHRIPKRAKPRYRFVLGTYSISSSHRRILSLFLTYSFYLTICGFHFNDNNNNNDIAHREIRFQLAKKEKKKNYNDFAYN